MTIVMRKGITVQPISRMTLPWICSPTASGERRRYFTAKYTISPAISSEKNAVTPIKNKYSASTRDAMVDAANGKSPVHISGGRRGLGRSAAPSFIAKHHDDETAKQDER